MFIGKYIRNIDKEGHITIPAEFREELGDHTIITHGPDGCPAVYTKEQQETIYEQLMKLPLARKDAHTSVRMMTSKTTKYEINTQDRALIPFLLVKLTEFVKECVVIGTANHVEIWSREYWGLVDEEADDAFENIAGSLMEFMI